MAPASRRNSYGLPPGNGICGASRLAVSSSVEEYVSGKVEPLLRSMTGHGAAHIERDGVSVSFEIRSVNGRHFKLTLRTGESRLAWSSQIESMIRRAIRRGTVFAQLTVHRDAREEDFRLEAAAIRSYFRQLDAVSQELGIARPQSLDAILSLPGIVSDSSEDEAVDDSLWGIVEPAIRRALEELQAMRQREGEAMAADLKANLAVIEQHAQQIRLWAPEVVQQYRERLEQRIASLVGDQAVAASEAEIAREVALFADRCDISEEMVRLESHCRQFADLLQAEDSQGKKLEFLLQEMNREANTTAAKANDSRISQSVVEIKAALERMREMVQNIE